MVGGFKFDKTISIPTIILLGSVILGAAVHVFGVLDLIKDIDTRLARLEEYQEEVDQRDKRIADLEMKQAVMDTHLENIYQTLRKIDNKLDKISAMPGEAVYYPAVYFEMDLQQLSAVEI